jgi:hypothetical protein
MRRVTRCVWRPAAPGVREGCATPRQDHAPAARDESPCGGGQLRLPVLKSLGGCGSTFLAKLLGSLPGVFVLNEVNPRSAHLYEFALNPARQVRDWRPDLSPQLAEFHPSELGDLRRFRCYISRLHGILARRGETLVLRDYNHVDYLGTPFLDPAPGNSAVRLALGERFLPLEVLVVRHPVHQFASIIRHRSCMNVLEPARLLHGYDLFLSDHPSVAIIRYEDLVDDTAGTVKRLCNDWDLLFDEAALANFARVPATGYSDEPDTSLAARSDKIADLAARFRREELYRPLLQRLGYPDIIDVGISQAPDRC